jgi:predicted 3-demethylubiquinone-9 3-methyltransferase (glyoxalase superfamily)
MLRITPMLWFDTQALEAAEHYCSIFPNSEVRTVTHYGDAGPREAGMVLTVDFVLDGQQVTALNGGPEFTFSEAVSFVIHCADQAEVDYYWSKLTEGGGEEGPCGWCKDRFGLSWQVVPTGFEEIMADPDAGRRDRAMKAMMRLKKLDLATLRAAADAENVDEAVAGSGKTTTG